MKLPEKRIVDHITSEKIVVKINEIFITLIATSKECATNNKIFFRLKPLNKMLCNSPEQ